MADFETKENVENNILKPQIQMSEDQLKNRKRITKEFLKKLLRSDIKLYYSTPSLNDILYLHYKGFDSIENLEDFTDLKVLYLEGNCISKIENLSNKAKLRALYLHENLINKIENIEFLDSLITLNLNDNFVSIIENLDHNPELESLQLKRNKIGTNGLSDVIHLTRLKKLASLDLSNNFIDGEWEDFVGILEHCPTLAVLYLNGNAICSKIPNYRKTLIARLKNLKYLDDRPVFPEDRIFAEAFHLGGVEAERKARDDWKKDEEERHWRNHRAFRDMLLGANGGNINTQAQNVQEVQIKPENLSEVSVETLNNDSVNTSKLETYYSKTEKNTEEDVKASINNNEDVSNVSVKDNDEKLSDSISVSSSVKETQSLNDYEALD